MKKSFKIVMILVLVFAYMTCGFTFGGRETEESEWFLQYYPLDYKVRGNTLYVDGMFSNASGEYDIVELCDVQIVLTDDTGELVTCVQVNDQFEKICRLAPYGSVRYNFTCDVSEWTIGSVYELRYEVDGEYYYAVCAGRNCENCGGTPSPMPNPTPESEAEFITCTNCKGNRKCTQCHGSGKNDCTSVVLKAMGCTLCAKTGKCHKCNGTGKMRVY